MKTKTIILITLLLAGGIIALAYFKNRKEGDELEKKLTELDKSGKKNPCRKQCEFGLKSAGLALLGLAGAGARMYSCRRCMKLNKLL